MRIYSPIPVAFELGPRANGPPANTSQAMPFPPVAIDAIGGFPQAIGPLSTRFMSNWIVCALKILVKHESLCAERRWGFRRQLLGNMKVA